MSIIEILVSMVLLSWAMAASYTAMFRQSSQLDQHLYQFYAEQQCHVALINLQYIPDQFRLNDWQQLLRSILPQAVSKLSRVDQTIQLKVGWIDKALSIQKAISCHINSQRIVPILHCQLSS